MKKRKIGENAVEKIMGICFFAVGAILFAIGGAIAAINLSTQENRADVKGILLGTDGRSNTRVEYIYEGRTYEAGLSEYSSSMHAGDEIALYVDKRNPEKVRTVELFYLPTFILCVVGAPFFILGFLFLFLYRRKEKRKQRLLQNGRKLYAEVTGGSVNFSYSVNGRHPYRLECRYTDETTGEVYFFGSYNVWLDPDLYLGQQVAVYTDPADYSKYYVDVEGLQVNEAVHDYR